MPANPKYLSSKYQRFLKTSTAIFGGYLVATSFHFALGAWFNHVNVLLSSIITAFILWTVLMVVAFLSKKGGRIWGLYLLLTIVFSTIYYLGKEFNPLYLHG